MLDSGGCYIVWSRITKYCNAATWWIQLCPGCMRKWRKLWKHLLALHTELPWHVMDGRLEPLVICDHNVPLHIRRLGNGYTTRAMQDSHTGSNIAGVLKRAMEEWGVQDKDPAIVTDNAKNMTSTAERAGMLHFKCYAHTLNLASQRALKLPAVQRLLSEVDYQLFQTQRHCQSCLERKNISCWIWNSTNSRPMWSPDGSAHDSSQQSLLPCCHMRWGRMKKRYQHCQ